MASERKSKWPKCLLHGKRMVPTEIHNCFVVEVHCETKGCKEGAIVELPG